MTKLSSRFLSPVLMVGFAAAALHAQTTPAVVLPPTVEGDWVRTDENHSGSFGELTSSYKQAELTELGKTMLSRMAARPAPVAAENTPLRTGQPLVTNNRTCVFNQNQLGLEYDSEGFHSVMNKEHITFVQERGWQRIVYLDNRKLADSFVRSPTGSGYSVGHIEPNGTLIVETTDLTQGRVTAGGFRTPETRVKQEYIPAADGKNLKLVFTWSDPKIYVKPHVYEFTFERMEAGTFARETFCDATDPLWGQSIVPPPQQ
ncbi:MAG: hypothetical protein ABL995_01020 [Bryobacteraceae bacterium]